MVLAGNLICRRFYRFVSLPHELAGSFLVGFLFSTWTTYLFALAFVWTENPMLWGNLTFFVASSLFIFLDCRRNSFKFPNLQRLDNSETDKWDWFFTFLVFFVSCWLAFGSFGLSDGKLATDVIVWNDFGPNLSLIQSFAVGHNFPTEYPHFIGEPIRDHFLFWFQAGNLTFLGLDIDWSLNILSAVTMTAMLVLVMIIGRIAFGSKAVGRIAALLFFFFGTLSYVPFLLSKDSPSAAVSAIFSMKQWLLSIYTYPGEQWGVWSLGTFMAQRHLPTAIGIFLFALAFLVQQIKNQTRIAENYQTKSTEGEANLSDVENKAETNRDLPLETVDFAVVPPQPLKQKRFDKVWQAYIFTGLLVGLLPLWNSAVYVSAGAVITGLLLLFPNRLYTLYLLIVSAIVAVPQILFLRAGESKTLGELFRWGYVVEPPTVENVIKYFSFTFGVKTLLALLALAILSAFHRRLFIALLALPILAFGTKLSTDMMNNHKFLHVWMILINLFVAYAIWRLWKASIAGKAAAALLAVVLTFGGVIELIRIYNDDVVYTPFSGTLYRWLETETKPEDVFLTRKYIHHPILLAGRRIFYGSSYFGWSMGYPLGIRDAVYKQMFEEQNPVELVRLLKENNIKYIAIDDELRNSEFNGNSIERICEANFQKVFVDKENSYGSLVIYKVSP